MIILRTRKEIDSFYSEKKIKSPGFVPTMGALHKGHISLVETAKEKCSTVAVSIFVNPTQFNDPEDLKKYPRTLDADAAVLEKVLGNNDFIFAPPVQEIYPVPDTRIFDFGHLGNVMEGIHRPGHFNGVAQVVSILFDIIKPSFAFFGQKDFQQLAIIRELARRQFPDLQIIACPIVRESDGLAMSSRNRRLLPEYRQEAPVVYRTLRQASEMAKTSSIAKLKDFIITSIEKSPGFRVEYFEIVDDVTLTPLKSKDEADKKSKYFGCIALYAGEIRLIDNMEFRLW
jgi:pantoate--beta-alanine ligase